MTNRITFQNLISELTGKISFLNSPDEINGAIQPFKSLTMLKYLELQSELESVICDLHKKEGFKINMKIN